MAPAATLYSVAALGGDDTKVHFRPVFAGSSGADERADFQQQLELLGDSAYDLAAASYDAAVRDALPLVTGSQPVLFVFSAGNDGNGDDTTDPGSGTADSIESPATAKNVITVGAIQEFRNITNEVTNADGTISAPWQAETSTGYRIAGFSSRGNVGIGTEGTYGRLQAGRGRAGNIHYFHPLQPVGHRNVFLSKSDELQPTGFLRGRSGGCAGGG